MIRIMMIINISKNPVKHGSKSNKNLQSNKNILGIIINNLNKNNNLNKIRNKSNRDQVVDKKHKEHYINYNNVILFYKTIYNKSKIIYLNKISNIIQVYQILSMHNQSNQQQIWLNMIFHHLITILILITIKIINNKINNKIKYIGKNKHNKANNTINNIILIKIINNSLSKTHILTIYRYNRIDTANNNNLITITTN